MKTKKNLKKKIAYLDYECQPKQRVYWETIHGERFEGTVITMDENNIATVKLDSGDIVNYEC
ncbi:hypothetical protein M0Q50_09580 [bacterium]|jgi:hypothetical protein|nr:hypothetical protein [bacterium]